MRLSGIIKAVLLGVFLASSPVWAFQDAILAIVGEEVITVKDLRDYLQSIMAQLKVEGKTLAEAQELMREYQAKGVEQLIDDRLILSAADKMGIQIRPEAVSQRLEEIKGRYKNYDEFLDAVRREGLTVTEIRKKIENQMKGQIVVNNQVRSKVYVNPQEVTEYFDQHAGEFRRSDRVFLNTIFAGSQSGREAAYEKIRTARNRLKEGEAFMAVAQELSELPSVGEMSEPQLRPEFRSQIDLMEVGDISGIVEVPEGFYILRMEGRKPGAPASLQDVKDSIYQKLFEDKFRVHFQEWIQKLRKKTYVEIKS
jgi:peptidyl-prolyl cis-trans isomerase SurA